MNLSLIKSSAEAAKASPSELEIWQMEISPDDVLRLVEVARAASLACDMLELSEPNHAVTVRLMRALDEMYTDRGD